MRRQCLARIRVSSDRDDSVFLDVCDQTDRQGVVLDLRQYVSCARLIYAKSTPGILGKKYSSFLLLQVY